MLFQPDITSNSWHRGWSRCDGIWRIVGKVSINIWLKAETVQLGIFVVYCCLVLRSNSVSSYCVFLLCRCGEAKTHISFSLEAVTLDVNSTLPVRCTSVLSGSKREVISLLLLAVYRNWRCTSLESYLTSEPSGNLVGLRAVAFSWSRHPYKFKSEWWLVAEETFPQVGHFYEVLDHYWRPSLWNDPPVP